jgi:hypothetical protein
MDRAIQLELEQLEAGGLHARESAWTRACSLPGSGTAAATGRIVVPRSGVSIARRP